MATPVRRKLRGRDRQNRQIWQNSQNILFRRYMQNLHQQFLQKKNVKRVVDLPNKKIGQIVESPKISKYQKILGGISIKELRENKRIKAKLKN